MRTRTSLRLSPPATPATTATAGVARAARGARSLVLAGLLALAWAGPAQAARLQLSGWPLTAREGEALAQGALRAEGDSAALASALGTMVARLQGEGWLDAHASGAWDAAAERSLALTVTPGVRWRWGSLALDVPREDSAAFAAELDWNEGTPARPAELTRAIERAVALSESQGHAWAQLGVSAWECDSGRVRVRLTGARGPRVTIGEVRMEGMVVTQGAVAERAMGPLRGRPYDPAAVQGATQRLTQLGVFRRAEYLGLFGSGDWRTGILRWRVEEPRYNTFEGALGVQGAAGTVGLLRLDLGNLLGSARAVSILWQSRGRGLADFAARYAEPFAFGLPLRLEGELKQQVQDTSYTRFRYGARGRVAVGAREHVEAGFEEERVSQARGNVQSAEVQSTVVALERDARDDAFAPRKGSRVRLSASQSSKRETLRPTPLAAAQRRNARSSAVEVHAELHRALGRASGVALESALAGRFSSQDVLTDWERYAVGGSASLRGHDEEAFHVDRYALTRLEWRYFLGSGGQRVALFWDHAEMQLREDAAHGGGMTRSRADGAGFGMRLPAAGGSVDLDYGLEPGRGFLDGKIHLRLVTAF